MKVREHPLHDCWIASGGEPLRYFEERILSLLDYPRLKSPGPPCQADDLVTLHPPGSPSTERCLPRPMLVAAYPHPRR